MIPKYSLQFKPPCKEGLWPSEDPKEPKRMLPWHRIEPTSEYDEVEGYCSGDWTSGSVVDEVMIPKSLPAGDYVVGFRWDCEETTQVWSSCADVRVTT